MNNSNYYILISDVENVNNDAILEGESEYLDHINYSFDEGISLPMDDFILPIKFELNEYTLRGDMTDHLSMDEIKGPLFSFAVQDLFQKCKIYNIEYLPLHLIDEYNEEEKIQKEGYLNYFIVNIVGLADCVNHEESKLEYFYPPELRKQEEKDEMNPFSNENSNEIDFVFSLKLDETKIKEDQKIFRLLDNPDLLVFHKSIVQAIREAELTGFVFIPIEEYTDEIPDDEEDEIEETQEEKEPSLEEIEAEKKAKIKQERREAIAELKARVKKCLEAGEEPSIIG